MILLFAKQENKSFEQFSRPNKQINSDAHVHNLTAMHMILVR